MSKPHDPKRPKRTTERRANGRKNRGHRSQTISNRLTEHRCELCGKRRPDGWGKVPRIKYGLSTGKAAHPYCVRHLAVEPLGGANVRKAS